MKKLMLTLTLLVSIVVSCQFSVVSNAYAVIPHLIRYQGTAVDTEGIPLEGPYNITFRIYNVEAGGTSIWEETHDQIPISKGTFSVLLGNSGSPLDLPFDTDYYLSIEISTDGEMTPRQRITSVGYAYRAETADLATEAEVARSSQAVGGYDIATEHSPTSQIYVSSPDGYLPEVVNAGSIKDSSITNSKIANSTINLSSKTTGTLPIEHGGTGTTQSRYCNLGLNTTGILPIQYGGTGSNQQTYCDLNLNTSGILPKEKGGTGNTTGNADNSDRVDGFHAASSPEANKLLALDASGKFPYSVLSSVLNTVSKGSIYDTLEDAGSSPNWVDCNGGSETLVVPANSVALFYATVKMWQGSHFIHLVINDTEVFRAGNHSSIEQTVDGHSVINLNTGTYTIKWQKKVGSGGWGKSSNKRWFVVTAKK